MARTRITSPQLNPSKTTDANGWTVYDYGAWKEYEKRVAVNQSITNGGVGHETTTTPPVGITSSSWSSIICSLETNGYDVQQFNVGILTRTLPTSIAIGIKNNYTSAMTFNGHVNIAIKV